MPYPNFHAFRVKSPGLFEKGSMRTKSIANGITIIMGRLKGSDTMTAQAYRFDKNKFTFEQAKKWITDHNIKTILQEKATGKGKTQAFVSLDVTLQAFSQDDIISRIPQNILDEIKQKDQHPFFQMYSIIHEGISKPKLESKGYKPILWFKKAIQSVGKVIKKGLKFFDGHNSTNDNQDKKILGEVIHAFEENINDKLHYCVIGYFPPETREEAKTKDVCSQEAEWNLIEVAGKLIADTCENMTGIALANSENQIPAFKDAKRLGFIQAFDRFEGNSKNFSEGDSLMTYEEVLKSCNRDTVKRLVTDLQLHPNQLFDEKGIREDRLFGKIFEKVDDLEEQLKLKDTEINDFKTKNNELNRSIQLQNAKGRLTEIYKDNKLTDNIITFVNDMYEESKEKLEDLTDEGLKGFVEKQTKIYQKANNKKSDKDTIPSGDNKVVDEDKNPLLADDYNPNDNV